MPDLIIIVACVVVGVIVLVNGLANLDLGTGFWREWMLGSVAVAGLLIFWLISAYHEQKYSTKETVAILEIKDDGITSQIIKIDGKYVNLNQEFSGAIDTTKYKFVERQESNHMRGGIYFVGERDKYILKESK